MSYPQIHPHPHIVWPDAQCHMIEFYGLVGLPYVSHGCPYLVHQQVVSWVQLQCPLEQIYCSIVVPFDEEEYR